MGRSFAQAFGVMLLAMLAAAPGARALDVKVPCGDAKTGLNECDEVKDRTVQLVSDRAKEIVEGWYRGEGGFAKRTCAVLPNVFNNGTPEIEQNHHQQDCGPSAQLNTRVQVIRKKFSVRVNSQTSVSFEGDHGTRERAYSGGAMVQAVDCWLKKIRYCAIALDGTCSENPQWAALPCPLRWPGAGSNRRPSDFQSDARTN